jgi:hypothetical protein
MTRIRFLAFLWLAVACAGPGRPALLEGPWIRRPLGPGITFRQLESPRGPFDSAQRISLLEADLSIEGVILRPLVIERKGRCEPTSALARKAGAVAAVNHWLCCGRTWVCEMNTLLTRDGENLAPQKDWGTGPTWVFGVTKEGEPVIRPVAPGQSANDLVQAGTGYGLILKDGRETLEYRRERFNFEPPFWLMRHPRTAVCVVPPRRAIFITVDGRSPTAAGMTLHELAAVMKELGCRDGLNLDGGGSTTLWARTSGQPEGEILNRPSDPTGERPTITAWGIFWTGP